MAYNRELDALKNNKYPNTALRIAKALSAAPRELTDH
jgi:hypothetical protein